MRRVQQTTITCTCGKPFEVKVTDLPRRRYCSRPCLTQDLNPNRSHGRSTHPLYSSWRTIKQRCTVPTRRDYHRYGGRGVTMSPLWLNDAAAFIDWVERNLGPRPRGLTLDRINNDGGYEPGNLRWATAAQQQRNQSSRTGASSDRLGVTRDRAYPGRWTTRITRDRRSHYIGYFASEDAAAAAYEEAASAWDTDGVAGIASIREKYRRNSSR